MNRGGLRPSETTLVIQAAIEGLDPQQVLLRDELTKWLDQSVGNIDTYVRRLGAEIAPLWLGVIRQATDKEQAIAELMTSQATKSSRRLDETLSRQ